MSRRAQLPPPPPPVEIRSWPDREALLADRAAVLGALVKAHVSPGQLAMLWLWGAICALGWLLVGTALVTFEESYDVISAGVGVIIAAMGVCCMVPAVVLVVIGLRRDRRIRRLLDAWGGLDRDPAGDAALRMPGAGTAWMLMSSVLCGVGAVTCFVVPATATPGRSTYSMVALVMGLGLIGWLVGLIGLVKASAHRRWVRRVLAGAPAPQPLISVGGGAHR
ncbi:hypothetical protein OOK13_15770 [Streptomyces sp. NBC_00378]|uniref:hypothetical protein n=1 Tax=unclassified Streptomyces TaxID=2593676 RepID=UPI0022508632|nr:MULTISPECIES: hypothetical protein [unclassified Streptomyces]MCX5109972.1 hypothetical protein [Streptomyces sp. NBC_00378]